MMTRRTILTAGGMAAALASTDLLAQTGGSSAIERSNTKLVTDFCAAWVARDIDTLMPYLAENVTYRITETSPPIVGRAAFHDRIKPIIDRMTRIEFAVTNTVAMGPVVLTDRQDVLESPQRTQRFHAVGMFYLVDGKIVEWTDYIVRD